MDSQQPTLHASLAEPPRLFHFGHFEERDGFNKAKELFCRGRLFFSDPSEFNDPFDCLPCFEEFAKNQARQFALEEFVWKTPLINRRSTLQEVAPFLHVMARGHKRVYDGSRQQWFDKFRERVSANARMLCLCEQWNVNLMWSHYANRHRGFAIELDFNREPLCQARDVTVQVRYDSPMRPPADLDGNWIQRHYSQKSPEWEYEHEWRICMTTQSLEVDGTRHFLSVSPESVSAIYLGWMFDSTNKEREISWLRRYFKKANLFKAHPDKSSYLLVPERFDPPRSDD